MDLEKFALAKMCILHFGRYDSPGRSARPWLDQSEVWSIQETPPPLVKFQVYFPIHPQALEVEMPPLQKRENQGILLC